MKYDIRVFSIAIMFLIASITAAEAVQSNQPLSVLLITIDNLRPDRMSVYDYEKDTTPYLNEFTKESIVFDRAFSTSAWTAPGVVSIFTGYYPPVHAQHGRFSYYDEEMPAAFRVLAAEGYEILG
ncbi:MAG: sulfatase-like hydrolase/transferase, partial [Arenicellales bacterium]